VGEVVRVRLVGGQAELGFVAASDVAKLLLGVERAVRLAASGILGRSPTTGRWTRLIEQVASFRLVGVERGSVVGVLELPDLDDTDATLALGATHLGEDALNVLLDTAAGILDDQLAASGLAQLADEIGVGVRCDAVQFEAARPAPIVVDDAVRERLHRIAVRPAPPRADTIVGTLVEADFERRTARLRAVDQRLVRVSFDDDMADEIQEALRRPAELVGEVMYDPDRGVARSVALRGISPAEQLVLGLETDDFWLEPSFEDLQRQQGIGPADDLDALSDDELTDDEADEFLAALGIEQ
jgi:hypothetical protein